MKKKVGILIFDGAEVLDFAGPFEVFSVASEIHNHELFDVFTIAESLDPITAVNGLSINPKYSMADHPPIDILIIAGGEGTRHLLKNKMVLGWVQQIHKSSLHTVSICTGALVLGVLGILNDKPYCTHHQVYGPMAKIVPTGQPRPDLRFVQAGKVFTSGGISAGIDLSFHLVKLLNGAAVVEATAKYMEYRIGVN